METPLTEHIHPDPDQPPLDIDAYCKVGGYEALHQALGMTSEDIISQVEEAHLRGRGGAGFPTGRKWSFIPKGPGVVHPKYLVVNADEMEPTTFKDRVLLEGNPHQLIEGIVIAACAVQADIGYVFLRQSYRRAERRLRRAMAEAYREGWLGHNIKGSGFSFELHLHASAGRYICGEETAQISALEGRRPVPRPKPPFPPVAGLWGKPTVVDNVETLCNVPHILRKGPAWYRGLSRCGDGGTKIYGASGRVKHPGAWELPMGTPLREIFEDRAGGMVEGYRFRGGGCVLRRHCAPQSNFDEARHRCRRPYTAARRRRSTCA